jgi:hypothetical protein
MGAPTPSMPQNPTNQPMQQSQISGKGSGKGGMPQSAPQSFDKYNSPKVSAVDVANMANSGQQTLNQTGSGKGTSSPNPNQLTPDGGNMTLSSTSGQPQTGQPNPYANTTGSWDNSQQSQSAPQSAIQTIGAGLSNIGTKMNGKGNGAGNVFTSAGQDFQAHGGKTGR